ncbi:MAG: hypothetical protein HYV63_08420 [Candidatus Schekmanbacteria bacterium]|nr:hypothetical protein [Candidatus Schekmanbacteria bacterium]
MKKTITGGAASADARPSELADVVTDEVQTSKASVLMACLLAWIFPGAGHFYLGRRGRALLIGGLLLPTFLAGLSMDAKLFVLGRKDPVEAHAGLIAWGGGVLNLAMGVPYFVAVGHKWQTGRSLDGNIRSRLYDVGVTYTLVAGLLNLLVILDAFELASGRKQRPPESP